MGHRNDVIAWQRGLRDVDEDRPGAPGGGDVERLRHGARDVGGIRDEEVVLGDRHRDAADVGLLEGVGADHRRAHLPGDRDHRHRVHVRVRDRRHEVGRAGARGGHADAHLAGGGGVPLGGVAGALLVADEDVPDRGVHEGVVRREDGAARDAEDVLGPCRLQRLDQALRPRDLGAGALLAHPLASFSGHLGGPAESCLPAVPNKKPLGRRATRGDARAVVCRLSSRVACIQEGPCACPHASPSLSPASRQSVTRPRIWTRHPPAGRIGASVAALAGGARRPCCPGRRRAPRSGRVLVADQRAAGRERGVDPLPGHLGRHPDVEVEPLARRLVGVGPLEPQRRQRAVGVDELVVGRASRAGPSTARQNGLIAR